MQALTRYLTEREGDAGARAAPVDMQRAARGCVLHTDGELFRRFRRFANRHRRTPEVLAHGIRNTPLPSLLADDQVPGSAGRDRVESVSSGRHDELAELQRLVGLERRGFVCTGAPLAALVGIDVLPGRPALERGPAVLDRNVAAVVGPFV